MKVNVAFRSPSLFDAIRAIPDVEQVDYTDLNSNAVGDVLVISERDVPYTSLNELTNIIQAHNEIYYLMDEQESSVPKSVLAVTKSMGIHIIDARITEEQVAEIISLKGSNPQTNDKNIIVFLSPISNIGTTNTVHSIGRAIAEGTNKQVGVLSLNAWDDSSDFTEYQGEFLDAIKPQLTGTTIETTTFLSFFHNERESNLHILGGNRSTKLERLYTKDEIDKLVKMANETFDIVLIDAGNHFDNASMIQSLYSASVKVLITNQQPKAQKKFNEVYTNILQPLGFKKSDFLMVVNQFEDNTTYPSTKELSSKFGVPFYTAIPVSEYSLLAEIQKKSIYEMNEQSYVNAIRDTAKGLAFTMDIQLSFDKVKKKSIFGFKKKEVLS